MSETVEEPLPPIEQPAPNPPAEPLEQLGVKFKNDITKEEQAINTGLEPPAISELQQLLRDAHNIINRLVPTHLKDQCSETVKKLESFFHKV